MSTSPSPPPTPPDLTHAYHTFQHYTALTFLLGAPILIALPPRKLDLYTFALGSSFALSANHLYRERRRRTMMTESPFGGMPVAGQRAEGEGGKTRYEIVQEQLRREKEAGRRRSRLLNASPDSTSQGQEEVVEEGERGEPRSPIEKGLRKVWMGSEKAGWKERRLAEEQEKISRGEGYGGMIMDQIWEVWNWGKEDDDGSPENGKGK